MRTRLQFKFPVTGTNTGNSGVFGTPFFLHFPRRALVAALTPYRNIFMKVGTGN
jgi:hypothetical protein